MQPFQTLLSVSAMLAVFIGHATAQTAADYPAKPVRVLVAAASGGASGLSFSTTAPPLLTSRASEPGVPPRAMPPRFPPQTPLRAGSSPPARIQ